MVLGLVVGLGLVLLVMAVVDDVGVGVGGDGGGGAVAVLAADGMVVPFLLLVGSNEGGLQQ